LRACTPTHPPTPHMHTLSPSPTYACLLAHSLYRVSARSLTHSLTHPPSRSPTLACAQQGDRWNYSDPTLLLLAASLGPAHLRVGGTGEDYLVYAIGEFANFSCSNPPRPMTSYRCTLATEAQITGLFEFATKINASVLFGEHAHDASLVFNPLCVNI
jgi:hypothetical protein